MRMRRGPILALLLGLASCAPSQPEPRLVLLITVDTLRADRLGAYGSDRALTPNLDALAAGGVVFTAAYAASAHTLPSIAALLTGRFPEEIGVWSNLSVVPMDAPTLARAFRAAGWATAAAVGSSVLRSRSGVGVGFARFDDELPQREPTRPISERVADATTRAALAALAACLPDARSRCFLWVHYQDPHGPYTPPGDLRERHLPRERAAPDGGRRLRALTDNFGGDGIPLYQLLEGHRDVAYYRAGYDGEVEFMDREVGRLLEGVRERGLDGRAVVAFTADHGESLGENGYWFAHGETLGEEQVRVPLLIRAPGVAPAVRDDLVAPVDLWPTLTGLAAVDAPTPGDGRDLFAPDAAGAHSEPYLAALGGASTPRFGLVDPRFKVVATLHRDSWESRVTTRGSDGPDLSAPAPALARKLRDRLNARMDRYRLRDRESRQPVDAEELRQLEALGYVDRAAER